MKKKVCRLIFSLLSPVYILSVYSSIAHSELIQGFPEGCAFATLNQALPYHILGYGRIRWMGAGWAFQYLDQNVPGPFSIAAVADNLGMMGQNPEQNISMDLLARTPGDKYVVAQILDRSEMGLGPIVTCISPAFFGEIIPYRPIVFGQDYWSEYRRFRDYRWDDSRRRRWERWKYRWNDRIVDWRRKWREKREHDRDRDRDRPRDIRPPKPGLIMPIKDREDTVKPVPRDHDRRDTDRDRNRQKPERLHIKLPEDADSGDRTRVKIQRPDRINIQVPNADKTLKMRPNIKNSDDDQQEERRPGRRKR